MSVAGIAASGLSQLSSLQSRYQQVHSQFKQLGQDLTSGNLAQAQTDFVTLSQSMNSQLSSSSPVGQALSSLGQALQSGNLSAAQQAFSNLPGSIVGPTAVHHRHAAGGSANSNDSPFSQALTQLGQALQSGDMTSAQQAFSTVQQMWQQGQSTSTTNSVANQVSGT